MQLVSMSPIPLAAPSLACRLAFTVWQIPFSSFALIAYVFVVLSKNLSLSHFPQVFLVAQLFIFWQNCHQDTYYHLQLFTYVIYIASINYINHYITTPHALMVKVQEWWDNLYNHVCVGRSGGFRIFTITITVQPNSQGVRIAPQPASFLPGGAGQAVGTARLSVSLHGRSVSQLLAAEVIRGENNCLMGVSVLLSPSLTHKTKRRQLRGWFTEWTQRIFYFNLYCSSMFFQNLQHHTLKWMNFLVCE